ncbi:MAG: hypothetical protein F2667_04370 [Actinobacteria bacterium]|uniref:Unannotated protein n=1 Tax=freshwater metagenome TaxID=449393 RepID=A0A6J6PPR5_9ZZZZ|nr:hypothetical protein [Actinomycetota bacterium]
MSTSLNGWAVIDAVDTDGPFPRLRKGIVPGTGRHLYVRDGSVALVLLHLALWFHEVIEPLSPEKTWDDWGWAKRPPRGSTTGYSNHASGTAVDLNATQHPQGVAIASTFTPGQVQDIRDRLTDVYGDLIDWGGAWRHPDGMHFEVAPGVTLAQVEKLARRLLDTDRGKRVVAENPGLRAVVLS